MSYTDEVRNAVKSMFLKKYRVAEIVRQTGVPRRTIYFWINKYSWDDLLSDEEPMQALARRMVLLADMEDKQPGDLDEMERTIGMMERLQKLYDKQKQPVTTGPVRDSDDAAVFTEDDGSGHEGSKPQRRRRKARGKRKNNDFRDLSEEQILEPFLEGLFSYQHELWLNRNQRTRNILKSRQIGATYYFSAEAFVDALISGRNKVFLSASKAQSDLFREYIVGFAQEWFGVELKGKDKVKVISDYGTATLYFLSTNSATSQGYHGDVYVDEYFWIPNFEKLNKVASAVSTHKHWRKTYFSTPSAKSHQAYPFWSGDIHNERLRRKNQAEDKFPDHKALEAGLVCPDGQWRKVITIHNAEAGGCDLFDVEQLRTEYDPDAFAQLFECRFIDDTASIFKLSELEKALCELRDWRDFDPESERPFGNHPVWIGYDPSRTRDGACIAIVAPPIKMGGKFRVLEKITLKNVAWQYQAACIQDLCQKYNVAYIGIDVTGPGSGVFDLVQQFYPAATPIIYSIDSKTRLVLKAQDVITSNRIQWDAVHSDIAAGFMTIRRTTTGSGQITYVADRSERTGHADAAWAVMHALINEGLDYRQQRESTYVFSDD